jgi:serine protease AprX
VDNVLKPDLVAPGNRMLGALATRRTGATPTWKPAGQNYPQRWQPPQASTQGRRPGADATSAAPRWPHPAVAGAVALMLQANPGLTPPLVKAILQYTAQPLPAPTCCSRGPAS